jgi:hypothetical protein
VRSTSPEPDNDVFNKNTPAVGRPRAFIYPANSVQGDKPLPAPVGTINAYGVREGTEWRWGDSCWKCSEPTEFGYCIRCTWVCDNSARPEPEPCASS